jgi:hypothetical protein
MQKTPEVKKANISQMIDMSDKNYCVDYPEDIKRIEKLINSKTFIMIGANENDKV